MIRTLFLLAFLSLVGFVTFKWATSGENGVGRSIDPGRKVKPDKDIGHENATTRPEDRRQPSITTPPSGDVTVHPVKAPGRDLSGLTIPEARLSLVNYPEIGAQRTGKILFLGTEVPRNQLIKDSKDPNKVDRQAMERVARSVATTFMVVETTEEELKTLQEEGYLIPGDKRYWRKWGREGDTVEPGKVNVVRVEKWFYPLKAGMSVKKGELLGVIDPLVAEQELSSKIAKLAAGESEVRAALKTKEEAKTRYERLLRILPSGGSSPEEVSGAKLTWERYIEEELAKRSSVEVGRREILQTEVILKQHEIRAPLSGVVQRLHKQPDESVKEQEPVLKIENFDSFQVEGQVEEQYRNRIREGMTVVVEPTVRAGPEERLRRHREPVTAVAVSGGTRTLVLSAGEDRTVRVWELRRERQPKSNRDKWTADEIFWMNHPAVVRSLSCTVPGASKNLCLSGSSDGTGILWNLDQLDRGTRVVLQHAHSGPILATAFSQDGAWCATAGEDKSICIFETTNGERIYRIDSAHKGAVTSLAFTKDGLVSTGRDNRMAFWPLKNGKQEGRSRDLDQRSGQVEQLGVSPDGEYVLFDQSNELRVLTLSDWEARGSVRNLSGSGTFTTFAHFSPDGRMVLTAGAADNRLQLWSNPAVSDKGHATEWRQFVWNDGPSTCAAFDPKGRFVVTGTRDRHVLVWGLPTEEELKQPEITGTVRHIGQALDSSSRQVRILVDVKNRSDRLLSGDKATLIIYPQ